MRSKIRGRNGNSKHYRDRSRRPSMIDLAWTSGIIEGEGSFTLESCGTSTRVTVSQKDPEILHKLQSFFGGSVKFRPARPCNKLSQSGIWEWHVYGAQAVGLMFTTYTWLSGRRRSQIRDIIARLIHNGEWRRVRQCGNCGTDYIPWKRRSTACSPKCLNKLWQKNHKKTAA